MTTEHSASRSSRAGLEVEVLTVGPRQEHPWTDRVSRRCSCSPISAYIEVLRSLAHLVWFQNSGAWRLLGARGETGHEIHSRGVCHVVQSQLSCLDLGVFSSVADLRVPTEYPVPPFPSGPSSQQSPLLQRGVPDMEFSYRIIVMGVRRLSFLEFLCN